MINNDIKNIFTKELMPDLEPILQYIFIALIFIFLTSSYFAYHGSQLAQGIAIESLSLTFTIFIIDYINEQRARKELKSRLIRQIGSSDNGLALNALAELKANNWLEQDCIFKDAWLRKANLQDAVAWGVDFSGGQLEEANFIKANLTNSKFIVVDLRLAIFDEAKLIGTQFKADLIKASFKNAHLQHSIFDSCTLYKTNFSGANLQGAVFKNCKTENLKLIGAIYNSKTQFPKNVNPEKLGAKFIEKSIPFIDKRYM
ncbi:pentapeptide repeat-containing protein [Candidatus Roizmanbacteria bacterium]|nr:MAG: pentapeptide repeat-containing protein [Candidatus Roizmanbacteria bacterium]